MERLRQGTVEGVAMHPATLQRSHVPAGPFTHAPFLPCTVPFVGNVSADRLAPRLFLSEAL